MIQTQVIEYPSYQTLSDCLRKKVGKYGWNQNILSPTTLLLICKLEEIRFAEKPLKRLCGRYSCINGRAKIVLNSQLTPGAKWFALARKLSAHYVSDDDQSDALAAIALLPTWMLYRFSRQQLIAWGYSQDFMNVRSVVMDQYPSLDCSAPADAHLIDFRNSLSEYLNLSP